MKILRVISSVSAEAGGPINGLLNSSKELVRKGHKVVVVSLDDPDSPWVEGFELPLVSFKSIGSYGFSKNFYAWLLENVSQYDVVVVHGIWQFHSFSAAKACQLNSVPFVTFIHGMLDPWFNANSKLKALKKNIYWKLFERHVINHANAVLFTSEEERMLARKSFTPYFPVEKVVAYGSLKPMIDLEVAKETLLSKFDSLKSKRFALFLSRIHEKKGLDLLIDALGKIKNLPEDFLLAIAGPDTNGLQAKFVKQIESLGLTDRVVWLGMLSGDVKWGAYHAADVFVLPSHQENFGIVVAEALSTATPVLITNKVNIWREIKAAGAGFVGDDDVVGIKTILNSWLNMSKDEKMRMSNKAIECYHNNFSIVSAVEDLERVLLDVSKSQ